MGASRGAQSVSPVKLGLEQGTRVGVKGVPAEGPPNPWVHGHKLQGTDGTQSPARWRDGGPCPQPLVDGGTEGSLLLAPQSLRRVPCPHLLEVGGREGGGPLKDGGTEGSLSAAPQS